MQEAERRVLDRRQNLETVLDGSDAEIQRDLNDFDNVMRQRTQELHNLQRTVASLSTEISQLREQTDQLNLKRGQAVMLQEQSKQLKDQQAQLGANLQRKYALPAAATSNTSSTGAGNQQAAGNWGPVVVRNFLQNLNNEVS